MKSRVTLRFRSTDAPKTATKKERKKNKEKAISFNKKNMQYSTSLAWPATTFGETKLKKKICQLGKPVHNSRRGKNSFIVEYALNQNVMYVMCNLVKRYIILLS